MSEMLYGGRGESVKGLNINMEQSLYSKLLEEKNVPAMFSFLNDEQQVSDSFFVYMGEVASEDGRFSVFGHNKIEKNGSFCHYVAEKCKDEKNVVFFNDVALLTGKGCSDGIAGKKIGPERYFSLVSIGKEINIDAKKRLVNNILEGFLKKEPRRLSAFTFGCDSASDFSSKSLFVLNEIMKYLPYGIRRRIVFASGVSPKKNVPQKINLVACPLKTVALYKGCVNLDENKPFEKGRFFEYIEKVFAMTDAERERYFEKLYNEIECHVTEKGIKKIYSDAYLLEFDKKNLWISGKAIEAVADIYASVDDVLKVYPEYLEIARKRLFAEGDVAVRYLYDVVENTKNITDFERAYMNIQALFTLCGFKTDGMMSVMRNHISEKFLRKASNAKALIKTVDTVKMLDEELLDEIVLFHSIVDVIKRQALLGGKYNEYNLIREKNYVDETLLREKIKSDFQELAQEIAASNLKTGQKVAALQKTFDDFVAEKPTGDYSLVESVFGDYTESLLEELGGEENTTDIELVELIDEKTRNIKDVTDVVECMELMADASHNAETEEKEKLSLCYRLVSRRMILYLQSNNLSYEKLCELSNGVKEPAERLSYAGISDGDVKLVSDEEIPIIPDGVERFADVFCGLIEDLKNAPSIYDAMVCYEKARKKIYGNVELGLKEVFKKRGIVILRNTFENRPEWRTPANIEKVRKRLFKEDFKISTITALMNCASTVPMTKKQSILLPTFLGVVVVLFVVVMGIGVYLLFDGGEPVNTATKPIETKEVITTFSYLKIENYLKGFDAEGYGEAFVVVGKPSKSEEKLNGWEIEISNNCGHEEVGEEVNFAVVEEVIGKSRGYYNIYDASTNKDYIFVMQQKGSKYIINDIFPLPENFGPQYDFEAEYKDDQTRNPTSSEFVGDIIWYTGYQYGYVDVEKETIKL